MNSDGGCRSIFSKMSHFLPTLELKSISQRVKRFFAQSRQGMLGKTLNTLKNFEEKRGVNKGNKIQEMFQKFRIFLKNR